MLNSLFEALSGFEPTLVGTYPLGLQVSDSDLDVICFATDLEDFERALSDWLFDNRVPVEGRERGQRPPNVTVGFRIIGVAVEVYCEPVPVLDQLGFRHFAIEARLLREDGAWLRSRVRALKEGGLKTEPAFATILGLTGDPYLALLELEEWSSSQLRTLIGNRREADWSRFETW